MKRAGNLMEKITSYDNIQIAYMKARRGKRFNKDVAAFEKNYDENISRIKYEIENNEFQFGRYSYFTIHDPKERMICAADFSERVVHHAIMNVCHNYFDRTLIDDTYATRPGKGVYQAVDKVKYLLARNDYAVKLDYRKYYDSISHDILLDKLHRLFKDKHLLMLFEQIVESYEVAPGKGLPIGNLTSQYFANYYLSSIDHEMKEKLRIPCYVRYMDDIVMASNEKAELHEAVKYMQAYSSGKLDLQLKSPIYSPRRAGVSFLGYKVMPHYYTLSSRSKRRFKKKYLKYQCLYEQNEWSEADYAMHIVPLVAFVAHANSYNFRQRCVYGYLS